MYYQLLLGLPLFGILSIAGCPEQAPDGYLRYCATDEECPDDLECLAVMEAEDLIHGCSVPCEDYRDCPVVNNSHCGGNMSYCAEGVCWAYECD